MRKISVLFTNSRLDTRAGSETYVRDVALALLRRGHRPVAFSPVLGIVADELRQATVPVIDDLARLGAAPDVIHGHHHLETLMAALTFPEAPIVHFCHGWVPWEEMPLKHPSVRRYVAVDEVCLDRLVREEGISPERTELVLNFIDLERFQPRGPLPPRPIRALVFSNMATAEGYPRGIRAACAARGVSLDIVGLANGNPNKTPEGLLGAYDLVFAKGRAALEAMAVGCAVVLADAAGCGPLVTPDNFDRLRARNFGIRELHRPHNSAWYVEQIAGYSPDAAARVCARVRDEASMEDAVDRLVAVYTCAMTDGPAEGDAFKATAEHLRRVAMPLKYAHALSIRERELSHELETVQGQQRELSRELETVQGQQRELSRELEAVQGRMRALESELTAYRALPTLRVRDAVLGVPVVGTALRASVRGVAKWLKP